MQQHVNLVDLVKSFPTNIFLQNLASIQKRTRPIKFDHLAEKSEKGSISNLSTKCGTRDRRGDHRDVSQSTSSCRRRHSLPVPKCGTAWSRSAPESGFGMRAAMQETR